MQQDLKVAGRRGLRVASHAVGWLTSDARMSPSFLIVGAQRCGTTSMVKALGQHPAVLPLWHKGVHYFDMNYDKGMGWYRGHFPLRVTATRVSRKAGAEAVTFESSPYYMFHPLAGDRIARDLPGVRLLVLVRDPVERAYSAHAHESARGFEDLPFAEAVAAEGERTAGEAEKLTERPGYSSFSLQHHAYLARGRYVEQLERLAGYVGPERVHVVDSQDFFADPRKAFDGVTDFLGLPRAHEVVFDRHNATPRPAPLPTSLRRDLEAHFQPYDERLAEWLGAAPSWRR